MLELSMNILDIVENSTRAGANLIRIGITEDRESDTLRIEIADNGEGMEPDIVRKALDPFYTSKTVRRVGLGLPFLSHAAKRSGPTVTAPWRSRSRASCFSMSCSMTSATSGDDGVA